MSSLIKETMIPDELNISKKGRLNKVVVPFPNSEISSKINTSSTLSIPEEDIDIISKIIERAKQSNAAEKQSTYMGNDTYNEFVTDPKDDIRRAITMYKKAMSIFVSFGAIGLISCTSFVILGLAGSLTPFVSLVGTCLTALLTTGVFFDFKKWEKNHV